MKTTSLFLLVVIALFWLLIALLVCFVTLATSRSILLSVPPYLVAVEFVRSNILKEYVNEYV